MAEESRQRESSLRRTGRRSRRRPGSFEFNASDAPIGDRDHAADSTSSNDTGKPVSASGDGRPEHDSGDDRGGDADRGDGDHADADHGGADRGGADRGDGDHADADRGGADDSDAELVDHDGADDAQDGHLDDAVDPAAVDADDDAESDPGDIAAQAATTVELDLATIRKIEADRALLSTIRLGDLNLADPSRPNEGETNHEGEGAADPSIGAESGTGETAVLDEGLNPSDMGGVMAITGSPDDLPPEYRALVSAPTPPTSNGDLDDGHEIESDAVGTDVETGDNDDDETDLATPDDVTGESPRNTLPVVSEAPDMGMVDEDPRPGRPADHSVIMAGTVDTSSTVGPLQRSFLRHPWLIVLAGLLPVLAATGWVLARTPTYAATARLLIEPIEDDDYLRTLPLLRRFGEPTRTVQTAAAVIDTRDIAARAATAVGSGWTTDDVTENILIALEGQTNVIGITASAPTPTEAIALANAYADAALASREELLQDVVDAEIIELERRLAAVPSTDSDERVGIEEILSELRLIRSDPTMSLAERASDAETFGQSSNLVTILGSLIMGLASASAFAVYLDWRINDRVRTIGEVELATGLPVLGELPGRFGPFVAGRWMKITDDTAFRVLRHRLSALYPDAIGVTFSSLSTPRDSSYVVANVSTDFAAAGRISIVLNCDPEASWQFKRSRRMRPTEPRVHLLGDHNLDVAPFDDNVFLYDAPKLQDVQPDHSPMSAFDGLAGPGRTVLVNVPSIVGDDLAIEASQHAPAVLVVRLLETPIKSLLLASQLVKFDQMDVLGVVVINSALRAD